LTQLTYLENLLKGYRERYARGEVGLIDRIKATIAQIETIKSQKAEAPTRRPASRQVLPRRGCCGGGR